jgi:arginase family enzyme
VAGGARLLLLQGRVADRCPRGIHGAAALAAAIGAGRPGLACETIGGPTRPSPPAATGWEAELEAARPLLRRLADRVAESLAAGERPVVIAGRCAASIATLPRFAAAAPGLSLVWFDAHADFNTPVSTTSGYLGGLVIAAAAGLWDSGFGAGLDADRVVLAGTRDIDPAERALLIRHGVRVVPPGPGFAERVADAVGPGPMLLHVDWDVLEPCAFPTEYRVPGGLRPAELRAALAALVARPDPVIGLEAAEFEPTDDPHETAIAAAIGAEALRPALERLGA